MILLYLFKGCLKPGLKKTPDVPAVILENQSLTYRQLNDRANRLAWYLKSIGMKPGTLAGICLERSLEMIIALLGILKAAALTCR